MLPFPTRISCYVEKYAYIRQRSQFLFSRDVSSYWRLLAAEEGVFSYKLGDAQGTATFGDIVVCPPGLSFERKVIQPINFHYFVFRLKTFEDDPNSDHFVLALSSGKITIMDSQRLVSNFTYLRKVYSQKGGLSQAWMSYFLQDILLFRELEAQLDTYTALSKDVLMQQAKQMIEQDFATMFSMKELAKELGLSPVQFNRRFYRAFQTTPLHHLTGLRLQKARALLLETNLTLEAIAQHCGYQSGFYLSRVFSRQIGLSPSQFRLTHRV